MRPGDSDQLTREYFEQILLKMRHIDAQKPSTEIELFGEKFATPVMTAALSHLKSDKGHGMVELAKGAKAAGALYWCGMGEDEELEQITATGAKTIKIIKPHADNREVFRRIEHAKKAGVLAVGMDVDHAFTGSGAYDVVLDLPMRPKSKEELREFVQAAEVPFIIKGVLSEEDAEKCLEIGAAGIIVSHHHGIMDYAVPPLQILPEILKVAGNMPVFVDCGFASGMDVFKALALGATAVGVGRALMEPLKTDGAEGACEAIKAITAQLAGVMARTGYARVEEIDASCLVMRSR